MFYVLVGADFAAIAVGAVVPTVTITITITITIVIAIARNN